MKKNKWIREILSVLLCLLLTAAVLPYAAAEAADVPCSLEIKYLDEKEPISGAAFRVWCVAGLEPHGGFALLEPFADSGVKLYSRMNNGEWEKAAKDLSAWAEKNDLATELSGMTDAGGSLFFSELSEGVYLVKGNPIQVGNDIYTPQTFCVVIPDRDSNGKPIYAVKASPKFGSAMASKSGGLTVTKTVTGNAGDREKMWHFTVSLSDKYLNGRYGDMIFTNGAAELALKHGQSAEARNLPEGIVYRVTEAEANTEGYTTKSAGATGCIKAGVTAKADFTNSKAGNPGKPPETRDNSHLGFWFLLVISSLIGVLCCLFDPVGGIVRRHKEKNL